MCSSKIEKQAVVLTPRNSTGPPCRVGLPTADAAQTAHVPGGPPADSVTDPNRRRRRPMTDNRCQRAKQCWPIHSLVCPDRFCWHDISTNGWSNFDETYSEYLLALTDDLTRFWRSKVKVTTDRGHLC